MMNEPDELLALAQMGMDAETFLRTPLGRFLVDKARREEADAMEELVGCDPEDAKTNRELRNRIHVSRMVVSWLNDAVNIGHAAHDQLKEYEDMEGS